MERRLAETSRAPIGVDDVTHVVLRPMNPLPPGRTDERVVVQCRDNRTTVAASHGWQIE